MTPHPRKRWTDFCYRLLAALCVLESLTSCAAALSTGQISAQHDRTRTDAVLILDEAIHLLGDPSSDYRKVLLDAVAALPGNAQGEVSGEIHRFLSRVPPTGSEFRCTTDFVRLRARQSLWRLRETLLDEKPAPVRPAVCYAAPFALDLTQLQTAETLLDIYGFDFDTASLQMVLVTSDGYQDVTSALVRAAHYHLAFKVGHGAALIAAKSQSLGLAWGHLIRHSIPLIQPTTRLCSSRVETVPGKTISYAPPSISGDRLLAGPPTKLWAHALLDYSNNKLEATICMAAAAERGRGDTVFSGCTVEFLYTTDPDRLIDGVLGGLSSHISYARGQRAVGVNDEGPRGPVREWAFAGLRSTSFESGKASVRARLNEIAVVSSEDDGCISPIAYLEAKRTTVLNPLTRQTLDRQLEGIDPAMLQLRPRFAK